MKVKPAREGLLVGWPGGSQPFLPAEGARVAAAHLTYWQRRIMDGDVVEIEDEPEQPTPTRRGRRTKPTTE